MANELKPVNLPAAMPDYNFNTMPAISTPTNNTTPDYHQAVMALASKGSTDISNTLPLLSGKDVDTSGRYPIVYPGIDNESAYAEQQSFFNKGVNGVKKLAGIGSAAFLGGTVGLVNGIYQWYQDGKFNSFYNNELTNSLNDYTESLTDSLPFYKTERQRNASWWEPTNLFSGNMLFDNIVGNMGYVVGAGGAGIITGGIINSAIKGLGAVAGLVASGAEGAATANTILGEAISGGTAEALGASTNRLQAAWSAAKAKGLVDKGIKAIASTAGEAGLEALNNSREFKAKMVEDYTAKYGIAPSGKDLEDINSYAESVGNTSYALNTAVLSASNYVMLPKIFSSSFKSEKTLLNNIARTGEKYISTLPQSGFAKYAYGTSKGLGTVFAKSEAAEEGAQYAITTGTQNYFARKARGEDSGIIRDMLGYGIKEALTSDEGLLNIFTGGVSGGLVSSVSTIKQRGVFGYGGDEQKVRDAAIPAFTNTTLRNRLIDAESNIAAGEQIQREREARIAEGDILGAKNLETDYAHAFIDTRMKFGASEFIYDEIADMRQQALTNFPSLQKEGVANALDTKETFLARLDNIEEQARYTEKVNEQLTTTFGLELNDKAERKYSDRTIDMLTYGLVKIRDFSNRISQMQNRLLNDGIITDELVDAINNKKSTKDAIANITKVVDETFANEPVSKRDEAIELIEDVARLAKFRKGYTQEYNSIFENPEEYELKPVTEKVRQRTTPNALGYEQIDIDKEYSLTSPLYRQGDILVAAPTVKIVGETEGGEYKVQMPNGEITYMRPEQFKDEYERTEFEPTDQIILNLIDQVTTKQLNKRGYYTPEDQTPVEYANSLGIPNLIDAIETELAPELEKYKQEQEEAREKRAILKTLQDELAKVQEEANKNASSTVTTASSVASEVKHSIAEENKKDASNIFITTSTKSIENNPNPDDYIVRFNNFMNNARNFKNRAKLEAIMFTLDTESKLGLSGAVPYMWGQKEMTEGRQTAMTNITSGNVVLAFVEVDKNDDKFFIDAQGNRLGKVGEPVDLNKVVLADMPTASLEVGKNKEGKPFTRNRENQQEEAEAYKKSWQTFRETKLFGENAREYSFKFVVSKGKPIINEQSPTKNSVGGNLLSNDILQNNQVLLVNTTGKFTHVDGIIYDLPVGRPFIVFDDLLQVVNNNTLSDNQAKTVLSIFKELVDTTISQSKGSKDTYDPKKNVFLRNILFFSDKEDSTSENKVYLKGTNLHIGSNVYDLVTLDRREKEILDQLKTVYHTVNNKTLDKGITEPFVEYYTEGDEVKSREWKSYQSYLLSPTTPDGKAREMPVTTSVEKQTPAVPYNYTRKYVKLLGFELPIEKPKKQPAATQTSEEASTTVVYDNSYPTEKYGDIKYKYTINDKGNPEIDIDPNSEAVKSIAKNPELIETFIKALKQNNLYSISFTPEEVVISLYTGVIGSQIKKDTQQTAEEKTAEEQPVINEEEVKSDIAASTPQEPTITVGEKNDDVFSLASEGESMNQEDIDTFTRWAKANLPIMPYQYLDNMMRTPEGRLAFGKVSKGVAYIVKSGKKGTEYHESFHFVFNHLLPKEQQDAMLNDVRSREGSFEDRASGKTVNYADATDLQIEEKLADDFADFRLGKIKAKSLSERILEFFRGILDFFKSIMGKEDKIERLFKAIDKGQFANKQLLDINKRLPTKFSLSVSERQLNAYVEDITARVFRAIMPNNKSLFDFEKINIQSVLNNIRETNPGYNQMSNAVWKELLVKTKDFISGLKVNFDGEAFVNINDENANKNDYAADAFSVDYKKSSPFAIKLLVSSLVKTKKHEYGLFDKPTLDKAPSDLGGGYQLVPYNQAFSTLLNHFQNVKDQDTFVKKLVELAKEKSEYTALFLRLKGSLTNKIDPDTGKIVVAGGKIDFDTYDDYDWRLFTSAFLTFTKQRPEAIKQFKRGNNITIGSAVQVGSIKDIKNTWYNDMLISAVDLDVWEANVEYVPKENEPARLIKKTGNFYTINQKAVREYNIKEPEGQLEFLRNLGINFGEYNYDRVSDKGTFAKAVNSIQLGLVGLGGKVYKIKGKQLDVDKGLESLSALYAKATSSAISTTLINVNGEQIQEFTDSNAPSYFESVFNSVETIDELLEEMPQLNDVYSASAELLKPGGIFFDENRKRTSLPLKVQYINGEEDLLKGGGKDTSSLDKGDRLTVEINQNIDGNYYILIPADSSTEWMMRMGNRISYDRFEDGETGIQDSLPIFHNYLFDEINLARDAERRSKAYHISNKMAKELRFFKGILSESMLDKVNELIDSPEFNKEIFDNFLNEETSKVVNGETITKQENLTSINDSIVKFLNASRDEVKNLLIENNQISSTENRDKQIRYKYLGLLDKFVNGNKLNKKRLSEDELNNILSFVNTNYILNNIELHKILFGDPYQFKTDKGLSEATKRAKSFLSQRRRSFDSREYTNFLNREMNKVDGIQLIPGDPGYHEFKHYLRTITTNDVYTVDNLANSDKPYADKYARNNETDASSRLSPTAYREIKKRNAQWPQEAEDFHQWQMAWTRQNWPKYTYTNRELEAHDIALVNKPAPNYMIDVLKPIVSGSKYGKDFIDNVIDKFSQVPIYYSMVKGKISEEHYLRMFNDKVDYEVVISGRKMGAEDVRELYNGNGTYNNSEIDRSTFIKIPWSAYGIQQENSYDREKLQTRGSQLNKLATVDLFSNGVPIGATPERQEIIREAVNRNTLALSNLIDQGYRNLLNKLGLEDLGGTYKLVDKSAVADILRQSMLSQQMSINALDSVTLVDGEFVIPFEASTNYAQIKNLLYSIVNKTIVSPKMNGFSGVQLSSAMMEDALVGRTLMEKYEVIIDGKKKFKYRDITRETYEGLSDEQKKNIRFGAKDLKFYEDEDGKRYCEIYLPNYLTKYFPGLTPDQVLEKIKLSPDGNKILSGIGFRIPTDALNKVEVFKVKGFLPAYMGRSVIVPSAITTKAGSDFDIDKLNMYLRSVYTDSQGDVRLVKLRGTSEQSVEDRQEQTKSYFRKVFDDTIEQEIVRLSKYDNFRDVLVSFFSKLEAIQQLEGQVDLNSLSEEDQRFYAIHENILSNIMDQATENGVMPSDYMRAQIETIGDVKDDLFAKILASKTKSQYVEKMYGKALENEFYDSLEELLTLPENFDRLVNPNTDESLKDLAKEIDKLEGVDESAVVNPLLNRGFMSGMRHAFTLAKKWVGVAAVNITGNSLYQKTQVYVKDSATSLLFPHNTVEINGQKHISLSGMLNTLGQYISDKLSEYANGFVDVAKDPYILKIIYSDRIVGSFMFLERAGVSTDTIGYFMNQPIIKKHINYLDTTKKSLNSINNINNVRYTEKAFKTSKSNLQKAKLILAEYKESGDIGKLNKLLQDGIKNRNSLNSIDNAIQHLLLQEFLKIVDLASANFKVSQAINYDTTNFRSSEEFDRKNEIRDSAKEDNLIAGIDGILESSFISPIINALESSTEALGEILVFNKNEFRQVLKDTLKYYSNSKYISTYKFRKIAEKATASFLDYLIYTKGPYIDLKGLLVDEDSVADKVLKYKESRKDIQILQKLSVVFRENAENNVKTVKLNSKLNNSFDENVLTGYMREMRNDSDPDVRKLYNDIVRVVITQGSVMNPGSLKRIVPLEDYASIIAPIMKNLVYDEDITNFARGNWFQKNMYYDRDVAVLHTPKFIAGMGAIDPETGNKITVAVPVEDYTDIAYPEEYELPEDPDILVKMYYMPTVVINKKLGATYDNKKLLRISENAQGAGSPIIVIPRILSAPYGIDEAVDFESAHTVPNKRYAVLESQIGDAINMKYGYELVTDDNQNPIYDKDNKGNKFLFYKAINLFGDPGLAVEYALFKDRSSFDNNTKIVDAPLSNRDIANEYGNKKFKKEGEDRDYETDALSEDLKC
jgi:hypothetical protein